MNPCSIISILFFFVFGLILFQSHSENYSNYHVNYPFDSYPTKKDNQFLVKLPYRSLDTRHYKKMYYNKSTPKCVLNGTCDTTPGYYQDYHGYFDHPKKLKSFALGYSVTGYPYSTYKFNSNKYYANLMVNSSTHSR